MVAIYAALADESVEKVLTEVGGKQFSEFKPMLVERAVEKLSPISAEMRRLLDDKSEIDRVLEGGAERARAIAAPILKRTYEIVGLK